MKRRDFLKLSAAPVVIPWIPKFVVEKAKEAEPGVSLTGVRSSVIPDTLKVYWEMTDEHQYPIDLQGVYEVYGTFKSPSGKFITVPGVIDRNNEWMFSRVSCSMEIFEYGWWECQMKLVYPNGNVFLTEESRWEHKCQKKDLTK